MVKSLSALQGIALGVALLMAVLYAGWKMASDGPPVSLADCLRTFLQTESICEDRVVLYRSIAVNEDIYKRLIEGRLSLAEAAAALREEIESRPAHLQPPIFPYERKLLPEDRYMLRLLARVEFELSDDPRRDEVVSRVRGEYRAYRSARTPLAPAEAPSYPALATAD